MACLVCHDVYTRAFERAGGRVVEGARLERVYGCKPIEGSNPSLSASSTDFTLFFNNLKIGLPRTHTGTHIYFLKKSQFCLIRAWFARTISMCFETG